MSWRQVGCGGSGRRRQRQPTVAGVLMPVGKQLRSIRTHVSGCRSVSSTRLSNGHQRLARLRSALTTSSSSPSVVRKSAFNLFDGGGRLLEGRGTLVYVMCQPFRTAYVVSNPPTSSRQHLHGIEFQCPGGRSGVRTARPSAGLTPHSVARSDPNPGCLFLAMSRLRTFFTVHVPPALTLRTPLCCGALSRVVQEGGAQGWFGRLVRQNCTPFCPARKP